MFQFVFVIAEVGSVRLSEEAPLGASSLNKQKPANIFFYIHL